MQYESVCGNGVAGKSVVDTLLANAFSARGFVVIIERTSKAAFGS